MKDKFQMSSIGELTFFLGLQVQQKEDGIFISQDKYVAEILKKFNYSDVKSASTPIDLEKPLVKDRDTDEVDVHLYRSMIGSLMYLTASRLDIMFAVCACARFQVTPKTSHLLAQTVVATSTTEAEYEAAASYCGQVKHIEYLMLNASPLKYVKRGQDTKIPQFSGPLTKVGDEAVHKELGDRMERATTTTSSLEAEQDCGSGPRRQDTILGDVDAQTRFEITSKQSNDPPLLRGYILGSGEDSMKLLELMEFCTQLSYKNRKSVLLQLNAAKLKLMMLGLKLVLPVFVYAVKHMLMLPVQVPAAEVNGVRQLQALVDKKRVIITESSIRRDLHLDDADGTDCLPTATIFEEHARMGDCWLEEESLEVGKEEKVKTYRFEETQERQDDELMFDTGVLDTNELPVEDKVDEKDEHNTKLDDSTAGETVTTASVEGSAAPTTIEEITLSQTLIQIKAAKPKVVTTAATTTTTTRPKDKRVVVQEPSEFRAPQEAQPSISKDNGKAMMEVDRLLAERLQSKEREELTDEEKGKLFMELMEKRRTHFAALRAQEKRNRPPTKAQKRT
ncbi:putative ribonuclease H-like domain-containing protein [Tanacetum coccineum]